MILVYSLVLFLVGGALFLIRRRAARLERRYYRAAAETERLINQPMFRPGNGGRADPYQMARRQYQLGQLVEKRDRLEAKFDYWQRLAKRWGHTLAVLRAWKGRKVPYLMGVLDVAGAMYLIDELTLGQYVSVKQLAQMVASLLVK
jgi:hypothetical protein